MKPGTVSRIGGAAFLTFASTPEDGTNYHTPAAITDGPAADESNQLP